jgi:hypothetical protein
MSLFARKARRMYRGGGATAAAANNFVGLFNNGTASEYLVLLNWVLGPQNPMTHAAFNFQGKAGSLVQAGVPIKPDEAAGPGQIFNGANPAGIATDYAFYNFADGPILYSQEIPFAIVPPGWLFGWTNAGVANILTVGLLWQVCHPEELLPDFAF